MIPRKKQQSCYKLPILLLLVITLPLNQAFYQHPTTAVLLQTTKAIVSSLTNNNKLSSSSFSKVYFSNTERDDETNKNSNDFDSLDVMLERARKRPGLLPIYKLQAFLDSSFLSIGGNDSSSSFKVVFTKSDVFLILIACAIEAYGFALGLFVGKVTARPIRELFQPPASIQIILMPLWPILWAIGFDQII